MNTNQEFLKGLIEVIKKRNKENEKPSLSLRFPTLIPLIIFYRYLERLNSDKKNKIIFAKQNNNKLTRVLVRHTSPLFRKLSSVEDELMLGKVVNLKRAIKDINGKVINPGETFSLWKALGVPTRLKGYTDGLLLSAGKPQAGVGGGLCQLANLLHWMFLHLDCEVIERHHHSIDPFPDSGRTLPFGTGATIFWPTLDLRYKNTLDQPIQIELWMTDTQLCGKLRSDKSISKKYHIHSTEDAHIMVDEKIFRINRVWRDTLIGGVHTKTELLYNNIFPTLYEVDRENIQRVCLN